jgi:putative mRNA 3-end processing factor
LIKASKLYTRFLYRHKVYLALYRFVLSKLTGGREILLRNGIELCIEGLDIYLDPRKARGVSFISHAHSDHTPSSFSGTLIASSQTCALLRKELKGECWHKPKTIDGVKFSLYDSGHIPGSKQLMIENGSKILYSGDLDLRGGLITPPAKTPKCDILIIEATFGTPRYLFPEKTELVKEMKDWIEHCISKGSTPVILGYSLGKAQELTKAFSNDFRIFVEESAYRFNKRTEKTCIQLGEYFPLTDFTPGVDSLMIVPPHLASNYQGKGFSVALASGWAGNYGWAQGKMGFPFSDHSDFNRLVEFVERVSPQVVYTTHGYAREFSRSLRELGFYSEPLSEVQTKLDNY